MKKLVSAVLMVTMCVGFATNAFALSANSSHETVKSSYEFNSIAEVYYEKDGKDIIEHVGFPESNIEVTRTVSPDDMMEVTIIKNGEVETSTIASDYELFLNLYNSQNTPVPMNSEITGSQYIHRYVGSPEPVTAYVDDFRNYADAAGIASFLFGCLGQVPAAAISGIAGMIFNRVVANSSDCYKVVISSDTYEVLLRADNSYYIHCYHQIMDYYKKGASTPYATDKDYYQAIGG